MATTQPRLRCWTLAEPVRVARLAATSGSVPRGRGTAVYAGVVSARPAIDGLKLRAVEVVLAYMTRSVSQLKVLGSVVRAVVVLVVDDLMRLKRATKDARHHNPVLALVLLLTTYPNHDVTLVVDETPALPAGVFGANPLAHILNNPRARLAATREAAALASAIGRRRAARSQNLLFNTADGALDVMNHSPKYHNVAALHNVGVH